MPQVIWGGQSGCLLPLLIILNLMFGRAIFNSTYLWLGIEAALILIFIIKIHVFMQKISQQFWPEGKGSTSGTRTYSNGRSAPLRSSRSRRPEGDHGKVVDVEGKVVE